MKLSVTLASVAMICSVYQCHSTVFTGLNGQTVYGVCEARDSRITGMANTSDGGSPLGIVQDGPEFTATFVDPFNRYWTATADFTDDYKIVFQFASPTPRANIGGPEMIRWHFWGFGFQVQDLQEPAPPSPYWDPSAPSFDKSDIWMGFTGFHSDDEFSSYTYQIVPVPEPATAGLLVMASIVGMSINRWTKSARGRFLNGAHPRSDVGVGP